MIKLWQKFQNNLESFWVKNDTFINWDLGFWIDFSFWKFESQKVLFVHFYVWLSMWSFSFGFVFFLNCYLINSFFAPCFRSGSLYYIFENFPILDFGFWLLYFAVFNNSMHASAISLRKLNLFLSEFFCSFLIFDCFLQKLTKKSLLLWNMAEILCFMFLFHKIIK